MKKFIAIICLLAIYCIDAFAQDTIFCKPEIKEVTIFSNSNEEPGGSQLELYGSVELKQGLNKIIFTNLPNFESFQIYPENNVELISSNGGKKFKIDEKEKNKKTLVLENNLEELNKEIDKANSMISIYTSEKEMILSNKTLPSTAQSNMVDEIRKLGDFYRQRISEIDTKLYEANKNLNTLKKELLEINSQISDLNLDFGETVYELFALVSSPSETKARFRLSLFETSATWIASYDIKVKDVKSPIDMRYKASISQETGINWKNVKVTLSSAQPNFNNACPEIKKWNLDYFNEIGKMYTLVEDIETPGVTMEKSIETEAFAESLTSFNYQLPQPMNIQSGKKPFEIEIITYQIPAIYEYVCVPKLDPGVFLSVQITDWEKYNFLTGNADLYLEGVYIGTDEINSGRVADTLQFSLGRDRQILVERNRITEYSKKTFLSGKRIQNVGWEISIRNNKKIDVDLNVVDQLPISVRKEIQVEKEDVSGAELDEKTGILQWKIHLKSAENKKVFLKYAVTYPKDKKIVID
jgi:uncharacterized protein (TIGR02231 family)